MLLFPILQIIVGLIVICTVLWLVQTYLPLPPPIKTLIIALIVLLFIVWLLGIAGMLGNGSYLWRR